MMFRALRKDQQRPLDELLLSRTHAFETLHVKDGWNIWDCSMVNFAWLVYHGRQGEAFKLKMGFGVISYI